jgi:hypothetical protein
MSKVQNLGIPSIDSLKYRIPIKYLEGYDVELTDKFITINESTGEQKGDFKTQSKEYKFEGFSIYASIQKQQRISLTDFEDCLIILFSSKVLKSKYFYGITSKNIGLVYTTIVDAGIMSCSFDRFLLGTPTDVDFKKDYLLELEPYKDILSGCSKMTKPSSNRDKGCTVFRTKENLGISWSVRKTNRAKTNPHLKIYHKGIELTFKSNNFRELYLKGVDVSDVIRIETTVKNKDHFKSLGLGLKNFSLGELLDLDIDSLNKIISTAVNCHLLPRSKMMQFKTDKLMSPKDRVYLNSMLGFFELEMSFDRVFNLMSNGIEHKVSKSRFKTTFKDLYSTHVKGTTFDVKVPKIDSYYDSIGWV